MESSDLSMLIGAHDEMKLVSIDSWEEEGRRGGKGGGGGRKGQGGG